MTRLSHLLIALALAASLGGCATEAGCTPGLGTPVSVFTLFMGKAIPGRADLTDAEWQSFLETTVSAALPNGYTVFDAAGGWMSPVTHKSIKEGTKVLLVALPEAQASLAAVNRIRTEYQNKFHQQLVGMTVERGCGTF